MPSVVIPPRDVSPNTGTGSAVLAVGPVVTGGLSINTGATSTGLTDLLVNPTTKFTGNLIDAKVNSVSKFTVSSSGAVTALSLTSTGPNLELQPSGAGSVKLFGNLSNAILFTTTSSYFNSGIPSGSTSSGTLVVNGGVGVSGAINLGGNLTVGGALKLGNTYVNTPQTSTGYVTLQDSTGTSYKVLVST